MRISIIAALSSNNVIGRDNDLPWHQSADLKRLKAMTMGHHMIMGRKTYETLPGALPGRKIIVVTRNRDFAPANVLTAGSVESALLLAQGDDEVFIAGGAEIYAQSMHR